MFVSNKVNAQTNETAHDSKATRLGVGLSLGASTTERLNFVIGVDLRSQKHFSGNVSGFLSVGYTNFSVEGEDSVNFGFIPVKVGIKVFPRARFYFPENLVPVLVRIQLI